MKKKPKMRFCVVGSFGAYWWEMKSAIADGYWKTERATKAAARRFAAWYGCEAAFEDGP